MSVPNRHIQQQHTRTTYDRCIFFRISRRPRAYPGRDTQKKNYNKRHEACATWRAVMLPQCTFHTDGTSSVVPSFNTQHRPCGRGAHYEHDTRSTIVAHHSSFPCSRTVIGSIASAASTRSFGKNNAHQNRANPKMPTGPPPTISATQPCWVAYHCTRIMW